MQHEQRYNVNNENETGKQKYFHDSIHILLRQ